MGKTGKTAVIGAGISGLCAAYWLNKHGIDVTVFEKNTRVGGSIITEKEDGYLIDLGPNSALETSVELRNLIDEIGLGKEKVYGNEISNNRYVVRNGQLHAIPMSPGKFIGTRLFSARAKLRLFKEPFIKPTNGNDLSLADFVRYRLGDEFLDYAINPFVAGVYAGDPENLSTAAAFPKLYALEQKYGSFIKGTIKGARERKKRNEVAKDRAKLFSFISGMQIFPQTLAEKLGDRIKTGAGILNLTELSGKYKLHIRQDGQVREDIFDRIVISVPTDEQARILKDLTPGNAQRIGETEYPPVGVVFTGFRKKDILRDLDGFGYLIPKVENKQTLGTIWSSTIFPERAPEGYAAFTTFVGGSRQPENAELNDEKLTEIVLSDLKALIGLKDNPVIVRIKRWPRAIPQYTMGYTEIQRIYNDLEDKFPGLYFAGNYRRGIGMGDSVLSAHETVQKMITQSE
ncbi:MAG: protoporphyrinogen oxidase [Calditrichaceae bacterium]|nr:protoporphyrinogen oxidase [Calditrichaceae bacterium]MBN2709657.1 protoporphyrinogen oxidase [Calditrichaceae bacterium]RQV92451.1 MAG: protoporphyrinogen oxidase [Calditrichota bacterium]